MGSDNKKNSEDKSRKTDDLELKVKKLESELSKNKSILDETLKDLHMCQGRLQEIREEKIVLNESLKELELMKLDLKLLNTQKVRDENNRIQHRIHITKKLLDEARDELKFQEKVIKDLEELKVLDRVRKKWPESLIVYKNRL
jgi:chromosome segregation ATPase